MEYTAQQIAELIDGTIVGNAETTVNNFNKIEEAQEGDLAFYANDKYENFVYTTKASILLIPSNYQIKEELKSTIIKVDDPYSAIAKLLQYVQEQQTKIEEGIDSLSDVHSTAEIGDNCYVSAFVFIDEGVRIGDNCKIYPHVYIGKNTIIGPNTTIYPNVTIYHDILIGSQCIIHAGAVIGADGFGFAPKLDGYEKIPQIGRVIIEDNVEIGANSCIDRASIGATTIKKGTKIDDLVMIAHNCTVGSNTVIASQTGMAGSSTIGEWCQIGGQTGIAGHLKVGNRVNVGGQTGILGNIEDNRNIFGSPAMDLNVAKRSFVIIPKLPELYKKITQLEKELNNLKSQLE